MTVRSWCDMKVPGISYKMIPGSFIPNNTSDPATQYGVGFSVTRAAAGRWLVTLEEPFADFVGIVAGLQLASSDTDSHEVRVGDISVANKTFEILHLTSADVSTTDLALADITASTTVRKIHFMCVIAREDIPGNGV